MAGLSIGAAHVSVGGAHITSLNSKGVVAVSEPEGEIRTTDIERVIEAAQAVSLPSSREIIHVLPRDFIVDAQPGIKDPLGMTGVRLEVETQIVTGATTAIRNLAKCIGEVGIDISALVYSGLASSEAVLTETEKELGVILVDIGAGTTDIAIFVDGALSYSSVLPVGAKNVTNDIAVGLRVGLESAEKIKLHLSETQKPKYAIEIDDELQKTQKKFIRKFIESLQLSVPDEWEWRIGDRGAEMLLQKCSKGSAVQYAFENGLVPKDAIPVVAGDDYFDRAAMEFALKNDGYAILVGEGCGWITEIPHRASQVLFFREPSDYLQFLKSL
jgi:hypothetical protein